MPSARASRLLGTALLGAAVAAASFGAGRGDAAEIRAADPSADPAEKLARIEQAMWSGDKAAVPELRDWAGGGEADGVRERSIGALAHLADKRTGPFLLQILSRDPSPRVRRAAAEAIGLLNAGPVPGPVPEQLLAALHNDPDPRVRAESARAIGRTGNAKTAPLLLAALTGDPSPEVRALAGEALAAFRLPETVEPLKTSAMRDDSPLVRLYSLKSLGVVAGRQGLPQFLETWETSDDRELRIEAYRQIVAYADPSLWERSGLSTTDDPIRFLAFRSWLSRIPPPTQEYRLIRGTEPFLRLEAFLSDRLKGIRELARAELIRHGYKVKVSGFVFTLDE